MQNEKIREDIEVKDRYFEHASYDWSEDSIRMMVNAEDKARNHYFYLQEIGYFKTKKPYFTERANLNSYLIIYTKAGEGCLEYLGKTYRLTAGKCFWIDCREYHKYWTIGEEGWEFFWFHFNGPDLSFYYQEIKNLGEIVVQPKYGHLMEQRIETMINLNTKKDKVTDLIISQMIYKSICEMVVLSGGNGKEKVHIPEVISAIKTEIEQTYIEPLTLSYFEKQYHRSKYYLLKEFKKYMGCSINEYIIRCRLSRAKEMLQYSEKSVNEIAEEVGILNVSHFINLFKGREGITPLNYRKQWAR